MIMNDLDKILDLKHKTETQISKILIQFRESTGLDITQIELTQVSYISDRVDTKIIVNAKIVI